MINRDLKLTNNSIYKFLVSNESKYLDPINRVFKIVEPLLNFRIPEVFIDYTKHDIDHSLRISQIMAKLIVKPDNYSELELTIMLMSALLHDIGMAISEKDINLVMQDEIPASKIKYKPLLERYKGDKARTIQDYVRRIHASLSKRFISQMDSNLFISSDSDVLSFQDDLGLICEAHTQDVSFISTKLKLEKTKGLQVYRPQFLAYLLRLADVLDFDDNRTPIRLYEEIGGGLPCISKYEWKQHFDVQNYEKVELKGNTVSIKLNVECTDPIVYRKIYNYLEWVQSEVFNYGRCFNDLKSNQYKIDLNLKKVIDTIGFVISTNEISIDYKAITALLMGESLYGDKKYGLRELVQNSIDTCLVRREYEMRKQKSELVDYTPSIKIIIDEEGDKVIVKDNGMGMDENILKNCFLSVGKSYYRNEEYELNGYEYNPIGNFGIGFLACFMLSNEIEVKTRHIKSKDAIQINLRKDDKFIVEKIIEGAEIFGTEISMDYKSFMLAFGNSIRQLKKFLKNVFITDEVKIKILDLSKDKLIPIINKLKPKDEKGKIRIDLGKYISGVEGYANVIIEDNFIRTLNDLNLKGEIIFFNPKSGLVNGDINLLPIELFIANNEFIILEFPIIGNDNYEDFNLIEEALSYDEAISKFSEDVEWISVVLLNQHKKHLPKFTGHYISAYEPDKYELFPGLTKQDILDLGHSHEIAIEASIKRIKVHWDKSLSAAILFRYNNKGRKEDLYSNATTINKNDFQKRYYSIYIRNVLLNQHHFCLPFDINVFDLVSITANIINPKIIPTISRSQLTISNEQIVNFELGRAIIKGVINSGQMAQDGVRTLKHLLGNRMSMSTILSK